MSFSRAKNRVIRDNKDLRATKDYRVSKVLRDYSAPRLKYHLHQIRVRCTITANNNK